ncbi:MAG: hypothetical protein NVS2B16_27400 [Chloroflexota bacterium]
MLTLRIRDPGLQALITRVNGDVQPHGLEFLYHVTGTRGATVCDGLRHRLHRVVPGGSGAPPPL